MISIQKISLFLGAQKPKLSVQNLELKSGLWALVGRNGAGKSTFLNSLSGINKNFEGQISIGGVSQEDISARDLAKQIAVVFSKSNLFGSHSALDVLNLGRIPYQGVMSKLSDQDKKIVSHVAELLSLGELIHKQFSVLSDGEKQLIMIGRALVQDAGIVLLDEPTAFLDVVNRKKIISVLAQIVKEQNKLVLFSTHNLDLVSEYCDGVLMIKNSQMTVVESKNEAASNVFDVELEKIFEGEI